jgi:hypothetical protein
MTHTKNSASSHAQHFDYSFVYMYLLTGIAMFVSVFLFLPRVSVG